MSQPRQTPSKRVQTYLTHFRRPRRPRALCGYIGPVWVEWPAGEDRPPVSHPCSGCTREGASAAAKAGATVGLEIAEHVYKTHNLDWSGGDDIKLSKMEFVAMLGAAFERGIRTRT